jgi:hypothetical protein
MSESAPQWRSTRALRAQRPVQGRAHATHAFPRNVVLTGEQLALDLDAAMRDEDDLHARIRAGVTEDGMSPEEIHAAVADALDRLGITSPSAAASARPCVCEGHSLVMLDAFALERRCALCGRRARA